MREITVALEDENLYARVEAEASSSGRTVQDIGRPGGKAVD